MHADLLKEAQAALDRIKAREGEAPTEWARRLAKDLAQFED